MATKKTTKKKPSIKKSQSVLLRKAIDPTFRLTWDDSDGEEHSLCIGTMCWGNISYEDALNLEKMISKCIIKYFSGALKKAKKRNAK